MERWEIERPGPTFDRDLELAAAELGLESKRMELKSLPLNVHWHFRRPGAAGTLEATWLPEEGKAWLCVHDNRKAEWIPEAARSLLQRLAETVADSS